MIIIWNIAALSSKMSNREESSGWGNVVNIGDVKSSLHAEVSLEAIPENWKINGLELI